MASYNPRLWNRRCTHNKDVVRFVVGYQHPKQSMSFVTLRNVGNEYKAEADPRIAVLISILSQSPASHTREAHDTGHQRPAWPQRCRRYC